MEFKLIEIRATFHSDNMRTELIVNKVNLKQLTPNITLISGCHQTISISGKNSNTLTVDTWKVMFTADGGELEVGGV